MKRTIFFIACLLISILAYPETTKPDYSDVSWGMTLDELIARGVTEGVTAQGEKRLSRQRQYHGFEPEGPVFHFLAELKITRVPALRPA